MGSLNTTHSPAADKPVVIGRSQGQYRFLFNFHVSPFVFEGVLAPTSEHHYNAHKTLDPAERDSVYAAPTPATAKRAGQKVTLRPNWDKTERLRVMREVVAAKFEDPSLRERLLATGDALLVEGCTHHDQFWGDCFCSEHRAIPGQNMLGQILMHLRAQLRGDRADRYVRAALTGHRPNEFTQNQALWVFDTLKAVTAKIRDAHGTTTAISGMALGADSDWAFAALDSGLDLWAYVPFEEQAQKWSHGDTLRWRDLRSRAAREVVLGQGYDVKTLHHRNALMVRDADLVVAVHLPGKTTGGTATTIRQARDAGKPMVRVNPANKTVSFLKPGRFSESDLFNLGSAK